MPDREKTIRELETLRAWHAHHYNQFHNECAATIQNALELLKEQEPKRGRWERITGMAPPEYHGHKICSVCECFAPHDPIHVWREILPKYCPGCGAKMEVNECG